MYRPRLLVSCVVVPAVVLGTAAAAYAGFSQVTSASQAIATATLQPPTAVSAAQINCRNNQTPSIRINWTGSTSAFVSGYTISRAAISGGPYTSVGTVSGTTSTFTDPTTTLAFTQSYYYVVDATYRSWTARSAEATITTLNNHCA
jgi:hypothetical protein